MKTLIRVVLSLALSATAATGCVAQGQTAAATASPAADNALAQSRVFLFDEMVARKTSNGGESRNVFSGQLKTGEAVGVHESVQPAGAAPVALHAIQHSEIILVQEGTVAFEHDGKEEKVGAGGVIYVAFGTVHRVKNVGDAPAKYFVVQVGGDTKK
jgi:mannose-6-phosphate isomerase-like protein (cupin superfamily)